MSYYRIFKPTEEMVRSIEQKSKGHNSQSSKITELIIYCMMNHDEEKISDVITHIELLLTYIKYETESNTYQNALDNIKETGEFTLCGREYSYNYPNTTIEMIFNKILERLSNITLVVKTPDWFDENEKFSEKQTEIKETIEWFEDTVIMCTNHEIINMLKDSELEDDFTYYNSKSSEKEDAIEYDEQFSPENISD